MLFTKCGVERKKEREKEGKQASMRKERKREGTKGEGEDRGGAKGWNIPTTLTPASEPSTCQFIDL